MRFVDIAVGADKLLRGILFMDLSEVKFGQSQEMFYQIFRSFIIAKTSFSQILVDEVPVFAMHLHQFQQFESLLE